MPERSFGRVVRYRRTKLGLSQAKLGQLVGRSPTTIRSWESDASTPNDPKLISTLAAILGVDERTMFSKAGVEQPVLVEDSPTVEEALASLSPDEPGEARAIASPSPYDELAPDEDGTESESISSKVMIEARAETELAEEVDDGPGILIELEHQPTPAASPSPPAPLLVPASALQPSPTRPTGQYVITAPATLPVEPSYIEEPTQKQLYRVRTLATIVGLVGLVIALLWAMSEGLSAFGDWWDGFLGTLRL